MKKFTSVIAILLFVFAFNVNAETYYQNTSNYSITVPTSGGATVDVPQGKFLGGTFYSFLADLKIVTLYDGTPAAADIVYTYETDRAINAALPDQTDANDKFLKSILGVATWAEVPTVTVPGNDTEMIFNDGGVLGASNKAVFNKATGGVTLTGPITATNIWTDAFNNMAFGGAMESLSSDGINSMYNIAIGEGALYDITSGAGADPAGKLNISIGRNSSSSTATMQHKMITIGHYAFNNIASNNTSNESVIIGYYARANGLASYSDIIIGSNTVTSNGADTWANVVIGDKAGRYLNGTDLWENVIIGSSAVDNNISNLQNSVVLGGQTSISADDKENIILLGYEASSDVSNTAVIGNSSVTDVYFGSTSGAATLHADGLQLTSKADPVCGIGTRGQIWFLAGGTGVADSVSVCTKDAGDSYAWRVIY